MNPGRPFLFLRFSFLLTRPSEDIGPDIGDVSELSEAVGGTSGSSSSVKSAGTFFMRTSFLLRRSSLDNVRVSDLIGGETPEGPAFSVCDFVGGAVSIRSDSSLAVTGILLACFGLTDEPGMD